MCAFSGDASSDRRLNAGIKGKNWANNNKCMNKLAQLKQCTDQMLERAGGCEWASRQPFYVCMRTEIFHPTFCVTSQMTRHARRKDEKSLQMRVGLDWIDKRIMMHHFSLFWTEMKNFETKFRWMEEIELWLRCHRFSYRIVLKLNSCSLVCYAIKFE